MDASDKYYQAMLVIIATSICKIIDFLDDHPRKKHSDDSIIVSLRKKIQSDFRQIMKAKYNAKFEHAAISILQDLTSRCAEDKNGVSQWLQDIEDPPSELRITMRVNNVLAKMAYAVLHLDNTKQAHSDIESDFDIAVAMGLDMAAAIQACVESLDLASPAGKCLADFYTAVMGLPEEFHQVFKPILQLSKHEVIETGLASASTTDFTSTAGKTQTSQDLEHQNSDGKKSQTIDSTEEKHCKYSPSQFRATTKDDVAVEQKTEDIPQHIAPNDDVPENTAAKDTTSDDGTGPENLAPKHDNPKDDLASTQSFKHDVDASKVGAASVSDTKKVDKALAEVDTIQQVENPPKNNADAMLKIIVEALSFTPKVTSNIKASPAIPLSNVTTTEHHLSGIETDPSVSQSVRGTNRTAIKTFKGYEIVYDSTHESATWHEALGEHLSESIDQFITVHPSAKIWLAPINRPYTIKASQDADQHALIPTDDHLPW